MLGWKCEAGNVDLCWALLFTETECYVGSQDAIRVFFRKDRDPLEFSTD